MTLLKKQPINETIETKEQKIWAKKGTKITFVKEYCTFAKDFRKNKGSVATIDVSTCHILEISNRDKNNNRTIFSLSHLTQAGLRYKNIMENSLQKIIKNFEELGGDINTAQVRIFGGRKEKEGPELRKNLKEALGKLAPKCTVKIPKGHQINRDKQSSKYLFSSSKASCVKEDLRFRANEYKDGYSPDLKNKDKTVNKTAVNAFIKKIDDAYYPVSLILDRQTKHIRLFVNMAINSTIKRLNSSNQSNNRVLNNEQFEGVTEKEKACISELLTINTVNETGKVVLTAQQRGR